MTSTKVWSLYEQGVVQDVKNRTERTQSLKILSQVIKSGWLAAQEAPGPALLASRNLVELVLVLLYDDDASCSVGICEACRARSDAVVR